MAFYYPGAGMWPLVAPDAISLNGSALPREFLELETAVGLSRDITQASTLTVTAEDPDRVVLNHPAANQASTISLGAAPGPHLSFVLVKVQKQNQTTALTFEDSVVNKLRHQYGQLSVAPGVMSRVDFAARLCQQAGVPFIGPPSAQARSTEPLSRGTSEAPNEDDWTCLGRIAQAINYRVFSDGTSVLFGDDYWLLNQPSTMTLTEFSDEVDYIDGDYDVGKPLSEITIYSYADKWTADPGAMVTTTNLGPLTGTWIVSSIQRDMHHSPITVQAVKATPPLPEPTPTG